MIGLCEVSHEDGERIAQKFRLLVCGTERWKHKMKCRRGGPPQVLAHRRAESFVTCDRKSRILSDQDREEQVQETNSNFDVVTIQMKSAITPTKARR